MFTIWWILLLSPTFPIFVTFSMKYWKEKTFPGVGGDQSRVDPCVSIKELEVK